MSSEKEAPPLTNEIELESIKLTDDDDPINVETLPKDEKKKKKGFWNKNKSEEDDDEEKAPSASLKELFSFATPVDCTFMIFAILCALALGCGLPVAMLVFGDLVNAFINQQSTQASITIINGLPLNSFTNDSNFTFYSSSFSLPPPSTYTFNCSDFRLAVDNYITDFDSNKLVCLSPSEFIFSANTTTLSMSVDTVNCTAILPVIRAVFGQQPSCVSDDDFIGTINMFSYYFIILAVATILIGYIIVGVFQITAERQIYKMRLAYYRCVLRQDVAWFDVNASGEVASRLVDDLDKVQVGIGEKCVILFQWLGTLIVGFAIGFYRDWRLTLALLGVSPFLAIAGALLSVVTSKFTSKEQKEYASAGAVAEEVLSSIKTVLAFGGEYKESERYNRLLSNARLYGVKKGFSVGFSLAYLFFIMFASYSIAFWFGGWLISREYAQGGEILTVFFCVLIATFSIGQAGPYYEALATAMGSAGAIIQVIKREPPIDSSDEGGVVLGEEDKTTIQFKEVNFNYPARPEIQVLKSFNLSVGVGQTVALVGHSGCGKSTIIQLLQRFYDVNSGEILVGSHSVKDLNLKSLRETIGVVSQEPILFDTTIAENIRLGREGATQEEIEAAAKDSNVHKFITELPQGYQTLAGEGGTQLSGGQKQRVAIARALLRNPKILLLDEATSALDSESERLVQEALDKAREGRTCIVIAHRLSTVYNADCITVITHGQVVESGTHSQLLASGGLYSQLHQRQLITSD